MNKTKQNNLINLITLFTVNQPEIQQATESSPAIKFITGVAIGAIVVGTIVGGLWIFYPAALGYGVATVAAPAAIAGINSLPASGPVVGIYYSKPIATKAVSINPIFNMPINNNNTGTVEAVQAVIHNPNPLNFGPTVKIAKETISYEVVEMGKKFELAAKTGFPKAAIRDKIVPTGNLKVSDGITKLPLTPDGDNLVDMQVDVHVEKIAKAVVDLNNKRVITKEHCKTIADHAASLHEIGMTYSDKINYPAGGCRMRGTYAKMFQEKLHTLNFNDQGVLMPGTYHSGFVPQKLSQCSQLAVEFYSRMNLPDESILLVVAAFNG